MVDSAQKSQTDPLRKRYIYKVLASLAGLVANLFIYSIVPRALGPASYGNFNFLSHFFSQLVEILDGRSTVGALVKASQRPEEKGLVVSYIYYLMVITVVVFGAIYLLIDSQLGDILWPEQEASYIYLAAAWGMLIWYHTILQRLCDAYGYTVLAEKVKMAQKAASIILLLGLYFFGALNLLTFFLYYNLTLIFLVIGFGFVLYRFGKLPLPEDFKALSFQGVRSYIHEYYIYTFPLLIYIVLEAFTSIVDRWLLQFSSGSREQGFFSLGFQISAISALFVFSIAALIEREFSIAHGRKDFSQLRHLFNRYIPLLFSFAAYFSCFTVFHAMDIIGVFAGEKYTDSYLVIVIMSAFPIFFTFGRILGSIYFATNQNKLYRNQGLLFFSLGMVLSYFLVGPKEFGGFGWGAVGLAIKIVCVYGALVVVQFHSICRILKINPWPHWLCQALVVFFFLVLSFASFKISALFPNMLVFLRIGLGGVLYSLGVIAIIITFPKLFGLLDSDFTEALSWVRQQLNWSEPEPAPSQLPVLEKTRIMNKKILLLSAGSSIHTLRWANGLADRGHEVTLATAHKLSGDLDPRVSLYQLPWSPPLGYIFNAIFLRRLLAKVQPHLMHVHYVSGYGTLGTLSGFQPRVLSVWGTDIFNFPYMTKLNKLLIHCNLKTARWVCSTSWVMAQATRRVYKNVDSKMTVTPFGVDLNRFKKQPELRLSDDSTIMIGTIKTLEDIYGIDILIEGFALARERIRNDNPQFAEKLRLVICGEGPLEHYLKNLAKTLDIDHVTDFKGFIDHSSVPVVLNQMDIYVAMSREESFGVAIIEASACEVPVLVSSFGGLPEVVDHGTTGYVIPENTAEGLSNRLIELILDPDLREEMGKQGRKRVAEHYAWQDNLELMEQVYAHVLNMEK